MFYSRSVEYGLRALTHLAALPKGAQKMAREIAAEENAPLFYLAKTLQQLARRGVLRSLKGPSGGFSLNRPPRKISLMDVVDALDGSQAFERCAVGLLECDDKAPCPLHDRLKPLRQSVVRYLTRTTLADLAVELERKQKAAARRKARKKSSRKASKASKASKAGA